MELTSRLSAAAPEPTQDEETPGQRQLYANEPSAMIDNAKLIGDKLLVHERALPQNDHDESSSSPSSDKLDRTKNDEPTRTVNIAKQRVVQIRLLVRRREAGALIGKRGSNIKRLRETFQSSNFSIPDTGNGPERVFCLSAHEDFASAILADITGLLLEKSGQRDDQIELKMLIHSWHAGLLIGMGGQSIKRLRNESKAAIKIFEMCCPFSNERVCAIKARPPIVVDTLCHIQRLIQENPFKGTIKAYDALNFDLALVDKYGGFLPEDLLTPASAAPNRSSSSQLNHHQPINSHQQQPQQPLDPSSQLVPIHSLLGSFYQQALASCQHETIRPMKRCSIWRAPAKTTQNDHTATIPTEPTQIKTIVSKQQSNPLKRAHPDTNQVIRPRYHPYHQQQHQAAFAASLAAASACPIANTSMHDWNNRLQGMQQQHEYHWPPRAASLFPATNRFNLSSCRHQPTSSSTTIAPSSSSQTLRGEVSDFAGQCGHHQANNELTCLAAYHQNQKINHEASLAQMPCLCMFMPLARPNGHCISTSCATQSSYQSTMGSTTSNQASFANNFGNIQPATTTSTSTTSGNGMSHSQPIKAPLVVGMVAPHSSQPLATIRRQP